MWSLSSPGGLRVQNSTGMLHILLYCLHLASFQGVSLWCVRQQFHWVSLYCHAHREILRFFIASNKVQNNGSKSSPNDSLIFFTSHTHTHLCKHTHTHTHAGIAWPVVSCLHTQSERQREREIFLLFKDDSMGPVMCNTKAASLYTHECMHTHITLVLVVFLPFYVTVS